MLPELHQSSTVNLSKIVHVILVGLLVGLLLSTSIPNTAAESPCVKTLLET